MKRRIFNVLAGLSLLLCVATVGIWVRSFWVGDRLTLTTTLRYHIVSAQACVAYCRFTKYLAIVTSPRPSEVNITTGPEQPYGSRGVIVETGAPRSMCLPPAPAVARKWIPGILHQASLENGDGHIVRDWLLVLVTATLPCAWLSSACRRRTQKDHLGHGLCPMCGDDLRATPDRCPECGTSVAGKRMA